jgi:hypothetical protein
LQTQIARYRCLLLAVSLMAAAPPAAAATCMYGPDGKVILQPDGSDCRDVAKAEAKASEFVAPRPTADGPWLEIRPGDEHLFAVEATQGRSNLGKPFRYTSYKGTQHREVVPGPERFGKGSMERRLTLRVVKTGEGMDQTDLQRDFIKATPSGYQLLAMNRFWYFKRQDVDLGEGSLLLPAKIERGAKWTSGRLRDDLFKVDETGEVIDLESVVTPAGTFQNCLHVRYTGDVGSAKARLDGRPAAGGRYVRDAWFARGVGLVKEVEDGRIEAYWRGDSFVFTSKYEAAIQGVKRPAVPAKQR